MRKMTMSVFQWCLTRRQVAHTSRPLTPREEVENIVADDFEERKTGRGNDGLVRGREYWCQTNETNGKGKGEGGKGEHEGKGGGFGGKGAARTMKSDDEGEQSTRKVQDEEEEVRGEHECREAKFERDLRQLEEKRRAQGEEAEVVARGEK